MPSQSALLGGRDFRTLLKKARARRHPLEAREDLACFRLFNAEGDGLPEVTVDWFAGVAVASLYSDFERAYEAELVDGIAEALKPKSIYLKRRPKEARIVANTQRSAVAPDEAAWGAEVEETSVVENGARFLIRPAQGLSVGLYLDMRDTRAWVRKEARGRSVLNLFAYTCGFGVAALLGGAGRVVNIDLSRKVLEWGAANARENGLDEDKLERLSGDAFEWLARLGKKGETFSMVILDPPGFSTSKKKAFSAATGYAQLCQEAAKVIAPGGILVAACNVAQFSGKKFEGMVEKGLAMAGRSAKRVASLEASSVDFPSAPERESPLKVRIYSVEGGRA